MKGENKPYTREQFEEAVLALERLGLVTREYRDGIDPLSTERLASVMAIFAMGLRVAIEHGLDDLAQSYLVGLPGLDSTAPEAVAEYMVESLMRHRELQLADFLLGGQLTQNVYQPPHERGKPRRKDAMPVRRRIGDFIHLTMLGLTLANDAKLGLTPEQSHQLEGDGAVPLACNLLDSLLLYEPAAFAAFLVDEQQEPLRGQIVAQVMQWSKRSRAAMRH
jgi:hypothetical protein